MPHSKRITKVKTSVKGRCAVTLPTVGWESVLADIKAEIQELKKLGRIVEKKLRHDEPWPTASPTRN
jgi:hypothetical protein